MKTTFKVLGYIFVFIAIFGGLPVIAREGAHSYNLAALAIFVILAILCFIGSNKLDNSEENDSISEATNRQSNVVATDNSATATSSGQNKIKSTNNETETLSAKQPDDYVKEMYSELTTKQRIAIVNLMKVAGASCDGSARQINEIDKLIGIMAFQLSISSKEINNATDDFDTLDKIIAELQKLQKGAILDSVFLACFDVIGVNRSQDGIIFLLGVFSKLGYSEDDCLEVLQKAKALMDMFK